MPFTVRIVERGTWSVLALHGDVDLVTAPRLRQEIVAQVAAGRAHLIVDLGDVDHLDSVGLGILVGGLKRTRTHDGDLQIVCPGARLRRVFTVTDLDRVFTLHETVAAAAGEVAA